MVGPLETVIIEKIVAIKRKHRNLELKSTEKELIIWFNSLYLDYEEWNEVDGVYAMRSGALNCSLVKLLAKSQFSVLGKIVSDTSELD